jgi:D-alanyl-D-alanine carboxypeptidase
MKGVSWHRGCPVGLGKLRLLEVSHWDFDGEERRGELVVHERVAKRIVGVMHALYRHRFPIRRMKLAESYGADDDRLMRADTTSGFNCRFVAGSPGVWSQHAYGRAIDVNPVENPYVTPSGHVSPPAGRPYADRSRDAKGMIHSGDPVVRAFRRAGWKWGGKWSGTKDYMHFSGNGR